MINISPPSFAQTKLPLCAYFEHRTDNCNSERGRKEALCHSCISWDYHVSGELSEVLLSKLVDLLTDKVENVTNWVYELCNIWICGRYLH